MTKLKRADLALLAFGAYFVWLFWPRKKSTPMFYLDPVVISVGDTNAE